MKKVILFAFLFTLPIFPQAIRYYAVEIDSGVAVSDSVDLGGIIGDPSQKLIAIVGDSAWTAANLTFQSWIAVNDSMARWCEVYNTDSTALTYKFADSIWVNVDPEDFMGIRYLKLRSGTAAVPVKQTTTSASRPRRIKLVIRQY